jgi:hypothetical protein
VGIATSSAVGHFANHLGQVHDRRDHAAAQQHGDADEEPEQRGDHHAGKRQQRPSPVAFASGTLAGLGDCGIAHGQEFLDRRYHHLRQLIRTDRVIGIGKPGCDLLVNDNSGATEIGLFGVLQCVHKPRGIAGLIDAGVDPVAVGFDTALGAVGGGLFASRERTAGADRGRQRGRAGAGGDAQILRRAGRVQQRGQRSVGVRDVSLEPVQDRLDHRGDLSDPGQESFDGGRIARAQRLQDRAVDRAADFSKLRRGLIEARHDGLGITELGGCCARLCQRRIGRLLGLDRRIELRLRGWLLLEHGRYVGRAMTDDLLREQQNGAESLDCLDRLRLVDQRPVLRNDDFRRRHEGERRDRQHRHRKELTDFHKSGFQHIFSLL